MTLLHVLLTEKESKRVAAESLRLGVSWSEVVSLALAEYFDPFTPGRRSEESKVSASSGSCERAGKVHVLNAVRATGT